MRFLLKLLTSAILIALASELAKKNPKLGGLIVSLPLTTILAVMWLYIDTSSIDKVVKMLWDTLIFLIPSLAFFFTLIFLLKIGTSFFISFVVSILSTILAYHLYYRIAP